MPHDVQHDVGGGNGDADEESPLVRGGAFSWGDVFRCVHLEDARRSANDPKLSNRGARRGICMTVGMAEEEAGAVTCGAVRL